MILGSITSIQVGRPRKYSVAGNAEKAWTSAIEKHAVRGSVRLGLTNLEGDEQADLKHHGGRDKAVLAYCMEHYEAWRSELPGVQFGHGGFGENLTVSGFGESDCCVGDLIEIADCRLQITQPRQPCWKLSRRWNLPKLAVRVQQTGRTGWYLRVLQPGTIQAGQPIRLIDRPFPDFSIAWSSSVMYAKPRCKEDDLRLAQCTALSDSWKTTLLRRASDGTERPESERLYGDSSHHP